MESNKFKTFLAAKMLTRCIRRKIQISSEKNEERKRNKSSHE